MKLWPWFALGYLLLRRSDVHTSIHKLRWPVTDATGARLGRITQEFSPAHPGVDISVPGHYQDARAEVRAVAVGRVVRAWLAPRGWAVLVSHGDWVSGYLHLAALAGGIVDGAVVDAGQVLGPMGADPLDAEHVIHLHLQIAPGGVPVDPATYLQGAV